jgi:uncharacterized iron-regulated membrane protein
MKSFFRTIHLYLSLVSGIFIMMACFTGSILVFEQEIQHALYHDRYFVAQQSAVQLPVETVLDGFKKSYPEAKLSGVKIYADPSRNLEIALTMPEKGEKSSPKKLSAFADPYTGKIIEIYSFSDSFFSTVEDMHRRLLGTDTGKLIMGTSTLLFLFIMISGVVLWWPKTKAMLKQHSSIKWKAGWKRLAYDFHHALGIYTVIFLFIFAFTALAWSFQWFNDGIYTLTNSSKEPIKPPTSALLDSTERVGIDNVLADAYTRFPNAVFYNLGFPKDSTAVFAVNVLRRNAIHETATDNHYYDQYSGQYLKSVSFADRPIGQQIRASFKPVHTSSIFGLPSKILGFLVCLFGTTFPITGVIMWLSRIKKI